MDLTVIDRAFAPFEATLRAQELFRRRIGVKEIDRPTYERYITGTVERFDRWKNSMMLLLPGNPFDPDLEMHGRIKRRTGSDFYSELEYSELESVDRIGQSLTRAAWRTCREYHPPTLPVTPREDRVDLNDNAGAARLIKKAALFFGAEMVRITRLDQRWVYRDITIPHEYAIVVVVSHVPSFIGTAPSHYSSAGVAETYSRLKFITTQLADFISGLGFDATYRETLGTNPELLVVPIAIDAGVGEFARTGHCLSPEFGVNMRIKVVTTDMRLQTDKPVSFGVHDFCMVCENCAKFCPGNAIPYGPPSEGIVGIYNSPGIAKWNLNAERCLTMWNSDKRKWTSCGGKCLSVCPWNKAISRRHNLVRWLAVHGPGPVKKLLVRGDRVFYGRSKRIGRSGRYRVRREETQGRSQVI
jgi:epoxyqueuosine reductase